MANRKDRATIAQQTIQILDDKYYQAPNGTRVNLANELSSCVNGSIHYTPEALDKLFADIHSKRSNQPPLVEKTQISVLNESTFVGSKALLDSTSEKVICLNFASAKNPGGGFLGGSQAQEEALARTSGLYASLSQYMSMYLDNREFRSCLYRNHIIYSPGTPVFRSEDDQLLNQPWSCSIITAPAVNYGALQDHEKPMAEATMRQRIDRVLAIIQHNGYRNVVLGAWGCGVFKNNPESMATYFYDALSKEGKFHNTFTKVRFSVLDRSKDFSTYLAFKEKFG